MLSDPSPSAVISADGVYRYFLSRQLSFEGRIVVFIGLNPSTADATDDDATIRRCVSFAKSWGGRELWMVNLFAYRNKNPASLKVIADPVGPDNDAWLESTISKADIVVAAWGNHATLGGRGAKVQSRYAGRLQTLKITSKGMPSHPLYIAATETLKPFP